MSCMNRKECRKYYFSVEGETEKWYLDWLEGQINSNENAKHKVKLFSKITKDPRKMVKEQTILGDLQIIHVFDFEESQNESAFKETLSAMKKATKMKKNIKYSLGYSNYTFELWIVLHKACVMGRKNRRSEYLTDINRYYDMNFESTKEYKKVANFKKILNCLTLKDVAPAISNAERIEKQGLKNYKKINYCGYEYFKENPSLSIHKFIKGILESAKLL